MTLAHFAGTLPAWITVGLIVASAWLLRRANTGQALSILEDTNRVLSERVRELERIVSEQRVTIASLEQRTNLEPLAAAMVEQFRHHEHRAQERHDQAQRRSDEHHSRTIGVLETIANSLGPDGS